MTQISLKNISVGHSAIPLFSDANLVINAGEKVCLIGRNGAGKSTLLRLMNSEIQPDHGVVERAQGLKTALLSQLIPATMDGTITQIVTQALPTNSEELWQDTSLVAKTISKLGLNGEAFYNDLSGGMKRLVLLSCILVQDPDVLMLDEPTNHLDIAIITTLENMLLNFQKTIIFVTHDRELLQKLATHIVEIDNGKLISWRGNYTNYLQHKETLLESSAKADALFDKKLAQEEQWIRQGVKARRTRNEGRVRMLKQMRVERSQRRSRTGQVSLSNTDVSLSGKIVFEVSNLSFYYDRTSIIKDFSTLILRGEKVGIIGPNGVGKSTLINLLLDKLAPSSGTVKHGTKLEIGYFDQHRIQLDENKTIIETISELGQSITVEGKEKHVISYLQDFLFSPEQARGFIKNLSGGERNRVMLAKLFSKPCNVLVLDEPTNDLDIETLELLEEKLLNFNGTLLLISHDRTFLNNVVTSTLVFQGQGQIEEFVGGYDDWLTHLNAINKEKKAQGEKIKSSQEGQSQKAKLTFKERQELAELPHKIESLEGRQQVLQQQLSDPSFYKEQPGLISAINQELKEIEQELINCYSRWEELERE